MKRLRAPQTIRTDALALAVRKIAAGCDDCAASYIAVARQYGATDDEIDQARTAGQAARAAGAPSRKALLKAAARGAAGLAGASAAGALLPIVAHAAEASPGSVVSGHAFDALVEAAMQNPHAQALRAHLEQRGFSYAAAPSRGFARPDGSHLLVLILVAGNGGKDFGQIVWHRSAAGQERVQGDLVHYRRDSGPTTSLAAARQYITSTTLAVVNGQVAPANATCDYWTCWWDHVIFCCGPAAIACIWSGPWYLVCLGGSCAACILVADWWCITCLT